MKMIIKEIYFFIIKNLENEKCKLNYYSNIKSLNIKIKI